MKLFPYILSVLLLLSSGCWYSFTGASISPDVRTFSVDYFPNRALQVQPTLSQQITEGLKDRFVSQTTLLMIEGKADLRFSGEILSYSVSPSAIQGNEQASYNRLTITIKVKFANAKDPKMNFETNFSRYADFQSSQSFETIEQQLNQEIVLQLTEDIFNKAVVNW